MTESLWPPLWLVAQVLPMVLRLELPENQANAFIFKAAMSQFANSMFPNSSILSRARLEFKDIEKVYPNFINELSAAQLLQSNPFFFVRLNSFRQEPSSYIVSGWACRTSPRFIFWIFVPAAIL